MRHLDQQGRPVQPDLLQHLSPLGWQHINLTGGYLWADLGVSDGKLRPLRQITRQHDRYGISVPLLCDAPNRADYPLSKIM